MRGEPPEKLVALLERLNLATAEQVRAARAHVRRLAGELPDFESVWVDALAQSRQITPFQAIEINAGRGDRLAWGPYVLCSPLPSPHYAHCFVGRHTQTHRIVRLCVERCIQVPAASAERALVELSARLSAAHSGHLFAVEDAGYREDSVWAACSAVEGTTAGEWVAENGRFPPAAVLHIAREMVSRLASLERCSQPHGDIGAAGLVLHPSGRVFLPMPGLRCVIRPAEGYGFLDLQPEAYDYLAPERIAEGTPPTFASDVYACGCLWWHLLTGRAPFGGGNSLARLKAVHAARLVDVRQMAPEVPEELATAILRCVARDPASRPPSTAEIATLLGPPARGDAAALVHCLNHRLSPWAPRSTYNGARRPKRKARIAVASLMVVVLLISLQWRARRPPLAHTPMVKTSTARHVPPSFDAVQKHAIPTAVAEPPARESKVTLAAAVESSMPPDRILSPENGWRLDTRTLKPGQRVRGASGQRPRVVVPREGVLIDCDDLIFENVDFVSEVDSRGNAAEDVPWMMNVQAQVAHWHGCSFSSKGQVRPVAIRWNWSGKNGAATGAELTLRDCVIQNAAAVVDCEGAETISVELRNTLCASSGPVVRLHAAKSQPSSVAIHLEHATLRGASAVLEWRYGRAGNGSTMVAISAVGTALDIDRDAALLVLAGAERPERLLQAITWGGEGSLVTPEVVMAEWINRAGKRQVLVEEELEIAGLVRSRAEFAGHAEEGPKASRLLRWQAPLRSPDPPGIDSNRLYSPRN
jgi:eukaryotic-like serine/threonine-protein kinase